MLFRSKAKKIKNLTLQPIFRLQPKFKKNGATIREIKYVADFMYTDENGKIVVEDVKGMKTDVYKIKKKMFDYNFPEYELIEV